MNQALVAFYNNYVGKIHTNYLTWKFSHLLFVCVWEIFTRNASKEASLTFRSNTMSTFKKYVLATLAVTA